VGPALPRPRSGWDGRSVQRPPAAPTTHPAAPQPRWSARSCPCAGGSGSGQPRSPPGRASRLDRACRLGPLPDQPPGPSGPDHRPADPPLRTSPAPEAPIGLGARLRGTMALASMPWTTMQPTLPEICRSCATRNLAPPTSGRSAHPGGYVSREVLDGDANLGASMVRMGSPFDSETTYW
jgi:hypothetical protein